MPKRLSNTPKSRKRSTSSRERISILFSCVGRRVELVEAFRRAAKKLNIRLSVHGSDISWLAPAMHRVDHAHIVPPLDDADYVETLLSIVREQAIDMIIPLIDPELMQLSASRELFNEVGCRAVVSSREVIATCRDKLRAYRMLKSAGIDTPATWPGEAALRKRRHLFPYFLKPREGSAGRESYKIFDVEELKVLSRRVPDPIVQEFVEGVEHTLDVYTGFDGIARCVVPRRRLEVRDGEVSKGMIVKDRRIMSVGRKVARALKQARGVITVQCIVTPDRRIRVIEINPRFGGGAPLGIHAGADYPLWLISEHLGRRPHIKPTAFKSNIAMLRFDDSVFCSVDKRLRYG
ncbi:MAG: ATP-grasp domain-containing protein [Phycisphaerae bacterium]